VILNKAYLQIYSPAEPNIGQFREWAYQQACTLLTEVMKSFSAKNYYQAHNLWLIQSTPRALGRNCHHLPPRKLDSNFSLKNSSLLW
jgi:hypothetical protein